MSKRIRKLYEYKGKFYKFDRSKYSHPMQDPAVKRKKLATFRKNFNEETRKRFRDGSLRMWRKKGHREKHMKGFESEKYKANMDRRRKLGVANSMGPKKLQRERNTSKSVERYYSNTKIVHSRKVGRELVEKKRIVKDRQKDYSGVITKTELEEL